MKSVVIVGVAARSFQWELDDEVWVINRAGSIYRGWHRWFHLHGPGHIRAAEGHEHLHHLITCARGQWHDAPPDAVYTPRGDKQVSGSKAFPYKAVLDSLGHPSWLQLDDHLVPHLHNSFPLLIALAVLEGATRITLDGVQFGYDKPAEQWAVPAIEWHLGRAAGKGIEVRVPPGSGLMDPRHLYGLAGPGSI